jgi:ABC-type Fe3+-hydroxamate transport system substrate-binding protein
MARAASVFIALLALLGGAAAAESGGAPPARRVVSLNPSLTAMLLALDAREVLVGIDSFSARQQPSVRDLPTVGGLYDPGLEAVVALQPDLVVFVPTAEQRDFQRRLLEVGLDVLPCDPVRWDEVLATIIRLGNKVGRSAEAERRVAEIRAARSEVERASSGRERPRAVLVLQRDPLYVVGRGSFIDEMLGAVGAENLAAEFDSPYPLVGREWLLEVAPEVILDSSQQPEGDDPLEWWSRWPSLPAVRDGRVIALPEGRITLPGPYLDRGLRELAAALGTGQQP